MKCQQTETLWKKMTNAMYEYIYIYVYIFICIYV